MRQSSLRWGDHPFRGVPPNVECLSVSVKSRQRGGSGLNGAVVPGGDNYFNTVLHITNINN